MKAILIDSANHRVEMVEYSSYSDMRKLIGGSLEIAFMWPSGDVLYVDEEGLLKGPSDYFTIPERSDQLLAGNGLLVGKETGDSVADINDPLFTVEDMREKIIFWRI